jgi:hypothetical protein
MVEASGNRAADFICKAGIALAGLLGLGTLVRLVFIRSYNYDELSHAHLTWLVSIGEVPYRDFAANHFPFLWILLSPVMWVLPASPAALVVLRGLALALNLVFLAAIGLLICAEQQPRERIWAMICFGLFAFSPPAMHLLIEFRPDAITNAVLFSILAYLRLRGLPGPATAALSGLGIGSALLINTKYELFPLVMGVVALVIYFRQLKHFWPRALALILGLSASLAGGGLLMLALGISPGNAWRMVVTYNVLVEQSHTFGHGLVHTLIRYPVWLGYGVVGGIACLTLFLRQRRTPELFISTIFIFLILDLFTATRPWKQYAVSWLLLAAVLPARSLPLLLVRLRPPVQAAVAITTLAIVVVAMARIATKDPDAPGLDRQSQDELIRWASREVSPDGFVVADLTLHPVFRRDTFYKVVFDLTSEGSDGLERFLPGLVAPATAEFLKTSGYAKELDAHPPAMIVPQGMYTDTQVQVLNAWVAGTTNVYEPVVIPGTEVTVLKRAR